MPDLHRAALHEAIGVFASDAGLRQRQHHALRIMQAAEQRQVARHIFGINDELLDHHRHAVKREIQVDRRVRADAAFDGRVRDVALMPEGDVFHRRRNRAAHEAREAAKVFGEHRVALVRHRRRAFLARLEEFFGFQNFSALQVAHFGGEAFDASGDNAEGGEERSVAIARNDLG